MGSRSEARFSSQVTAPWHAQDLRETLTRLDSNRTTGLTTAQASQRLDQYGLNELEDKGGRSPWSIIIDQFKNVMLLMLIGIAVISGVLSLFNREFPKDAIAIMLIVGLNGILGYLQESRAEKALAALKKMAAPIVRVMRDGQTQDVDGRTLVPGDVFLLEAGMQIAADGRLLEAANLQVRESALTGEAEAVTKKADTILQEDTSIGDRINLVFQGTEIVHGRGVAVVISTGMTTELGRIATMLQTVETEPTPLQRRMTQLGNVLVSGSLILVGLVVGFGVLQGGWSRFQDLLEVSLSMAVAVVPEGLPAVITVTLAIGTQRMVRRHALIRKLPAVETLGSVTTICSDKTGTLTQNKMVVKAVSTVSHSFSVTGEGYVPSGEFHLDSQLGLPGGENIVSSPMIVTDSVALIMLMVACVACNDAALQKERGEWAIVGDPTEGALLALSGKANIHAVEWSTSLQRLGEVPFTSERKRMSVVIKDAHQRMRDTLAQSGMKLPDSSIVMFTKGSPELILDRCTICQSSSDHALPFTQEMRKAILDNNNLMASKGLRVLGFAYKILDTLSLESDLEASEQDFTWLGLTGMFDAPRPEVRDAVKECLEAGIRPKMITGDHQLTAQAIATELGIASENAPVLNGQELETLNQAELEQQVHDVNIYARVAPEHKLRIVQALQKQGGVIAMTGDGVNDAPALKQADIGIAMGITGTDVSKEASDMVLLDDNFTSIVAAAEEGRVVYSNIRRFVRYILGSNIGEVLTIAASPILVPMGGVPLTPLQILWMNLVTDGLPALALAVEPSEPNVMKRPPYDPNESIFARGMGSYMVRIGIIFSIFSIVLMVLSYHYTQSAGGDDVDRWKTMVFTMLCLSQMGHAIAVRSDTQLTIEMNPFSNPYVLIAVVSTTILQLMLIYVPPLREFFGTQALNGSELLVCVGFSSLMFVWVELEKLFIRWWVNR